MTAISQLYSTKKNKGYILIYTLFVFVFIMIIATFAIVLIRYTGVKMSKIYEEKRIEVSLEGDLWNITLIDTFLKKGTEEYQPYKNGIMYKLIDHNDGTKTVIGYSTINPSLKKYITFHNGYFDHTDRDYQILEEGYFIEDE